MKKGKVIGGVLAGIFILFLLLGFMAKCDDARAKKAYEDEERTLEYVRENYSIDEVFDVSDIHRYASECLEMLDKDDVRWYAEEWENMIGKDDIWLYVNEWYRIDEIYDEKKIRDFIVEKYDLEDIAEWYK